MHTEVLPTSVVTPPVERAPGSDRTHAPRDVDRPVPATAPSRARPLAVVGALTALAVAAILGSNAVRDAPTTAPDGGTTTAPATAPDAGTSPAPSFDPGAPGASARRLADWLRQQEG